MDQNRLAFLERIADSRHLSETALVSFVHRLDFEVGAAERQPDDVQAPTLVRRLQRTPILLRGIYSVRRRTDGPYFLFQMLYSWRTFAPQISDPSCVKVEVLYQKGNFLGAHSCLVLIADCSSFIVFEARRETE